MGSEFRILLGIKDLNAAQCCRLLFTSHLYTNQHHEGTVNGSLKPCWLKLLYGLTREVLAL